MSRTRSGSKRRVATLRSCDPGARPPLPPAPMLASPSTTLPAADSDVWIYEPKYDGIRVLASIAGEAVTLRTRAGGDMAVAFPDIVEALGALGRARCSPDHDATLVLDGEIVALADGAPTRLTALQPRLFVRSPHGAELRARRIPAAFIAFDCLERDGERLVSLPWRRRRAELDAVLDRWTETSDSGVALRSRVRASEVTPDGARLLASQSAMGGEGIIAKRAAAIYQPGRRSADWRKLKLETTEEFIVLGVRATLDTGASRPSARGTKRTSTRPLVSASRELPRRIGALVVGDVGADGRLTEVGTVGSGLTREIVDAISERLDTHVLREPTARFDASSASVGETTWVEPLMIVTVRYLERTPGGRLRQPVFVGLRLDLTPRDVMASSAAGGQGDVVRSPVRPSIDGPSPPPARARVRARKPASHDGSVPIIASLPGVPRSVSQACGAARAALERLIESEAPAARGSRSPRVQLDVADVVSFPPDSASARGPSSESIMDDHGWHWEIGGTIQLGLTNLSKRIGEGVTKGDLLRYYVTVAPYLLRALAGRPLVLKRYSDTHDGRAFYQQHVNTETPAGVQITSIGEDKPRFVGGALVTLLYLAQLGARSMDPWHGRDDASELVDYTIIDLDPGPESSFARVVDVARWVHDELVTLGLNSVPKTSGASGIHIVVPLPGDTPAVAARLIAELVATQVAARHRAAATVARSVRERGVEQVYVDYLQNIPGKTVASVYSARATSTLTVSTPLHWAEVNAKLDPRDFTIRTLPERLVAEGDLWADAMACGNDLEALRRTLGGARGPKR